MKSKAEVAILLATYNGEKFIEEQLLSIFHQSYSDFHLYISDDCSDDSTVRILNKFKSIYPDKITLNINKKNIGYINNFNLLLSLCKEQYISFSDQDDIWDLEKIKIEVTEIKKIELNNPSKPVMVHSDLECIDSWGCVLNKSFFDYKNYSFILGKDLGTILGPCGVMGNTILMNRQLYYLVFPFPKGIDFHDYFIATVNECFGIRGTIQKQLVKYRLHSSNYSNNNLSKQRKYHGLPYKNTKKAEVLKYLLDHNITNNDRLIISRFLAYITSQKILLADYWFLLRNHLLKNNTIYRIKVLLKFFIFKLKS